MESDLITRINAIRNSEEYKRLGTKSRGKHEKSRFDILNNQVQGLETQLAIVRKAKATPVQPATRGTNPPAEDAKRVTGTGNTTPSPITIKSSEIRDNTRGESDAIKQYANMIKSQIDDTRRIRLSLQTFDMPAVQRTEEVEPPQPDSAKDSLPDLISDENKSADPESDENPEFWNKLNSLNFTITDSMEGTF